MIILCLVLIGTHCYL